jgi:hypothetical protein
MKRLNPLGRRFLGARAAWVLASFTVFSGIGSDARAASITVTGAADYFASVPACVSILPVQNYTNCTNNAYLDDVTLTGDDAEFKKSFDAWNATNAVGSEWTLIDGTVGGTVSLLDTIDVTTFDTFAAANLGGVEIQVEWTPAHGVTKTDYQWSQGLFDNYLLTGAIVPGFYEMDIKAAGCSMADDPGNLLNQCPPLYPFQYANRMFYDKPQAPWPNSFFHARAFLSQANFTTRELTIYDGVAYGFVLNAVPEPTTVVLTMCGLAMLAARRRRSAQAA